MRDERVKNRTRLPDLIAMAKIRDQGREIETLWKAATSAPSPLPSYAPASLQWRPLNVQRFSLKLNANAEREEKELSLQQQEEQDTLLPLPQLSLPPPSCCCMCCINCNTNCRACCSLSVYLCVSHRYICRCCWMRNVVVAQANGTRHTARGTTRRARQHFMQSDGAWQKPRHNRSRS